jgi:hypothetical protein
LLIQFQTIRCLSVGAILGLKIWWHWCYLIRPSKLSQRVYSPNSLFWASFSTCIWRWVGWLWGEKYHLAGCGQINQSIPGFWFL